MFEQCYEPPFMYFSSASQNQPPIRPFDGDEGFSFVTEKPTPSRRSSDGDIHSSDNTEWDKGEYI